MERLEPTFDPQWVTKTINEQWDFMRIQLGHWNKLKVIAVDHSIFEQFPQVILDGLAKEAT